MESSPRPKGMGAMTAPIISMIYLKHKEFGNRHVERDKVDTMVASGWVVWPRSKDAKNGRVPDFHHDVIQLAAPEIKRTKRAYNRK